MHVSRFLPAPGARPLIFTNPELPAPADLQGGPFFFHALTLTESSDHRRRRHGDGGYPVSLVPPD